MDKKSILTKLKLTALILLLGVFIAIVVLIAIYYDSYTFENDYAIIFDAGSSGTRMYIYYWQTGLSAAHGDELKVNQLEYCKTNDKGIDKFTSKSDVILSFNDCMQLASNLVPQNRKHRTYISLAATAGMRLLNVTNSTASNQILNFIADYFNATEFLFKDASQVQIIDGSDEGIDAWISVNYFLNKFSSKTNPSDTIGTLDLGGASTQIVFISDILTKVYYNNDLKIYGVNYNPFSNSYLCWGANQIALIYQTYLLINNNYTTNAPGSCYPKNYDLIISTSQILNSPCANGQLFNYSSNFNASRFISGQQYTIKGTSNATQCTLEMSLLFPVIDCTLSYGGKCTFNGIYLPPHNKTIFYAFSSLYYQFNNTQALSQTNLTTNLESFKETTNNICSLTYDQLISRNNRTSANIPNQFLSTTCFTNNYVISLLGQYGINNLDNVKLVNDINGNTVGWTLGYLINQLNRDEFLPYEAPVRKLEITFFITAISVASCLTIFFLFTIVFYMFSLCQRKERSYF